jgi:hypothetical protein
VVALSRELKVHWRMLYRWKSEQEAAEAARLRSAPEQRVAALREEITALKIALADKAMEIAFFKGALRNRETLRRDSVHKGGEASTTRSGK